MGINKNFVVKQGLEVSGNLIFADATTKQVGINTNDPEYDLDVRGYVGVSTVIVSDTLKVNGAVSLGSSVGALGQYLISTGSGVAWQSLPNTRNVEVFTATPGQITFNVSYIQGLLDVFINGVKLSAHEFTATNGTSVTLADACFGGETVEFVVYSAYNVGGYQETTIWNKTSTGIHTTSKVGIGTTNPTSELTVSGGGNFTGIVTAIGGFISAASTTPIQITLVGNKLSFTAVGIGSTTLTLA